MFALALTESHYGWSESSIRMAAKSEGDGKSYRLTGAKVFVHDALHATDFLVAARVDGSTGVSLFHVDAKAAGVSVRHLEGFITGMGEVLFDNVAVDGAALIGTAGAAWTPLARALLAVTPVLCAYKVGGCRVVYDMSVNYARERTQFGQIIGRFARVQDHIIHMVNYLDAARWTTYEALWKLDSGADAAASIHVAKSVSSESYLRACDYAHEIGRASCRERV